MTIKELAAIIFIGIGTYLLRYVPLKAGVSRPLKNSEKKDFVSQLLEIAGISIIASLLVSSVGFPEGENAFQYLLNVSISSFFVILTSLLWRNPGISVISGIVSFALIGFFI